MAKWQGDWEVGSSCVPLLHCPMAVILHSSPLGKGKARMGQMSCIKQNKSVCETRKVLCDNFRRFYFKYFLEVRSSR